MSAVSLGRLGLITLTTVLLIISLILCVVALVTPAWQTVYLAEFQAEHQHGLWMDCTLNRRHVQGMNNDLQCTYKFESAFYEGSDYSESVHAEEEQHKFHSWHGAVLTFIAISLVSGTVGLCFVFCAACIRICGIVANVLLLISTVCLATALSVFFINSHKHEVRFVHGITMTYEQSKGYSFYLGVASLICLFISFLSSVPATVLVFLHDRQQHRPNKTFPKDQPITV
ncbi:unnamed protein product [Bursaphelenchus okinawaensis]|uniref:Clc-like protein n=1 Tax=Bursaphelenchus okinawaensis TaxID=465554 RepID=A0A811KUQ3_9BILA|nr:unnamed protein product [Bursaphelenchus okinawaensis]CAG9113572.1 unnamed protein product [Bursaphelenchus okinawaensis]